MKKISFLLACALLLSTASLASAACSPEEAQKKANEFAAAVQKKSQADPQGYAKIMQELQPQLLKVQQEPRGRSSSLKPAKRRDRSPAAG